MNTRLFLYISRLVRQYIPLTTKGLNSFSAASSGVHPNTTNATKKLYFDRKYEELMKMINTNYSLNADVEIR